MSHTLGYIPVICSYINAFILWLRLPCNILRPQRKKDGSELYGRAGQFARNGLHAGKSRATVLVAVQSNDTCDWVKYTWTVRLYDPIHIAGFQLNVWLIVPLCTPIEGRNVFRHLSVHVALAYDCALAYRFLWSKFSSKLSNEKLAACWPNFKWFGVNVSKSCGLQLTAVIGFAFSECTRRRTVVSRTSSVTLLWPKMSYGTCLTLRTHSTPESPFPHDHFLDKHSGPELFLTLNASYELFLSANKILPLSRMMIGGVPRRAINLSTQIKQEFVSREGTTSMSTALVVEQVNKKPPSFIRTSEDWR